MSRFRIRHLTELARAGRYRLYSVTVFCNNRELHKQPEKLTPEGILLQENTQALYVESDLHLNQCTVKRSETSNSSNP
jgi:hypothetical protein